MIEDLLSKQDAHPLIEAHLIPMRECVERGWEQWRESVAAAPRLALGRKTTRANAVYDFVSAELESYFDAVSIPNSRKRGYLTAALGGGRLEVRFKKFDHPSRLTTSGVPTSQRRAIQHQQVTFDGMAVTCITVGYYPDELGICLDVIAVSCTYGRELVWSINLRDEGAASAAVEPIHSLDLDGGPAVRSTRKQAEEQETEVS